MANPLLDVSDQLAAAVQAAGEFVLAVAAHPRAAASGIHWREGVVVSTAHTLKSRAAVELTLPDGNTQTAKLAGKDPATDLAVFRVEGGIAAPAFAEASSVRAGNLALAVGRTAREVTASLGVISAVSGSWRTWHGGWIDQHVQVDIGLYPSTNGGAVLDAAGRVVGMVTDAFSRFGAIAIPAATVDRMIGTLLENGYVPRGYLGVGLRPVALPAAMRNKLPLPSHTGLIALSVEPGSAAEQAGLQVGDILVGIDNVPVRDPGDVQTVLGPDSVGKTVNAMVLRGGQLIEAALTIGERGLEQ